MAHTALLIERLLQFSLQHSLIGELDAYVARNTLLDLFGLSEPWADGVRRSIWTSIRTAGRSAG